VKGGLDRKIADLRRRLGAMPSAAVALSGGADSAYLAAEARAALGARAVAITVDTPLLAREERRDAAAVARRIGIQHLVLKADPLSDPRVAVNAPDRCYRCKRMVFRRILEAAREAGIETVVDGTQADDAGERRPGRRALRELGVRSPLAEAGFTKADVRAASRRRRLPTAGKPSNACLATRFRYGTRLEPARLRAVGRAEEAIRALGFPQVRLRVEGDAGRLELPVASLARAAAPARRASLLRIARRAGLRGLVLDLRGYRSGSMDDALRPRSGHTL
jgi:uncharacterized protein